MGVTHVIRYYIFKQPRQWVLEEPFITRNEIQDWYSQYKMRQVGTVVIYDISGINFCHERELPLYECCVEMSLKYEDQFNRGFRSSRRTTFYGFPARGVSMSTLPENYERICTTCLHAPDFVGTCGLCRQIKVPWIPITSCLTRSDILATLGPQSFEVSANYHTIAPFKEELIAKAMHPDRPNLLQSVCDIEEWIDMID